MHLLRRFTANCNNNRHIFRQKWGKCWEASFLLAEMPPSGCFSGLHFVQPEVFCAYILPAALISPANVRFSTLDSHAAIIKPLVTDGIEATSPLACPKFTWAWNLAWALRSQTGVNEAETVRVASSSLSPSAADPCFAVCGCQIGLCRCFCPTYCKVDLTCSACLSVAPRLLKSSTSPHYCHTRRQTAPPGGRAHAKACTCACARAVTCTEVFL